MLMGMYLWRRTLWSPVITHVTMNAIGLTPLLVALLASSSHVVFGVSVEAADQPGGRVKWVMRGSPAEEAQLKVGDVITSINGEPVDEPGDVSRVVGDHQAGDRIQLTLERGGRRLEVEAELRVRRAHVLW